VVQLGRLLPLVSVLGSSMVTVIFGEQAAAAFEVDLARGEVNDAAGEDSLLENPAAPIERAVVNGLSVGEGLVGKEEITL